jgi:hypothetical protein
MINSQDLVFQEFKPCLLTSQTMASASPDAHDSVPSTSFIIRRVNGSTFLIIEDDGYGEQPYIYVKVYPKYLLVTDTGANF